MPLALLEFLKDNFGSIYFRIQFLPPPYLHYYFIRGEPGDCMLASEFEFWVLLALAVQLQIDCVELNLLLLLFLLVCSFEHGAESFKKSRGSNAND